MQPEMQMRVSAGSEVLTLQLRSRETFFVKNSELIPRRFPVDRGPSPRGRDSVQRQPNQCVGRVIATKVPAGFDDPEQLSMKILERARGVYHASELGW